MRNLFEFAVMHANEVAPPEFNPGAMVNKGQALAVALLSTILIVISLITAFTVGSKGNFARAAAIVGATIVCLIPAGIGLTYSMRAFLPGLTSWIF